MGNVFLGAAALGLLWSIMTTGVFISFRVLSIPDLTVDGSIVLGAAVAAMHISSGGNPFTALALAMFAGTIAGIVTGLLHTKLHIPALLSGILCMIALYSVNIRVMNFAGNVTLLRMDTVFTPFADFLAPHIDRNFIRNSAAIMQGFIFAIAVIAVIQWFFSTEIGNAIRATGNNIPMAKAQGVNTDTAIILGLAISNGLVGLSGGLIAQYFGFADVQMGQGSIVIGLASVIIGEGLFGTKSFLRTLIAIVLGAVTYRFIIALVLEAGMRATDLNLFTAATVALALYLPYVKGKADATLKRRKENAPDA